MAQSFGLISFAKASQECVAVTFDTLRVRLFIVLNGYLFQSLDI